MQAGCPDLTLVIADEQTAGRGRMNRRWFTPPGGALAFSLGLMPDPTWWQPGKQEMDRLLPRLTALGALAVCQTLSARYHLPAQIKWPNDVLVNGRKLAGVLVEAEWEGDQLRAAILGIGMNIAPGSVPAPAELLFPATSLEDCLGRALNEADRLTILRDILENLLQWRTRFSGVKFLQAWQENLAYKDEWVWIVPGQPQAGESQSGIKCRILGLDTDGGLLVEDETGVVLRFVSAEVHLRPPILNS